MNGRVVRLRLMMALHSWGCAGEQAYFFPQRSGCGDQINIALNDDLVATGSTKVAGQGEVTSTFFDCRTVLPRDACDGEQIAQADAFAQVLEGKATVAAIPFLVRPNDFVLDSLRRFDGRN